MEVLYSVGFKDELLSFSNIVKEKQDTALTEIIADEIAFTALLVLKYISYKKVPDAFLGCAALNLLNTYVKQPNSKIGYTFRVHIVELLQGIKDIAQPKTLKVFFETDQSKESGTLMFLFWNFQFGFHSEHHSDFIRDLQSKTNVQWDGIRKQKCAKSIFDFALTSNWISNVTLGGSNLRSLIQQEQNHYRNGKYLFVNKQLIKTTDIQYATDIDDKYQKNYIRVQLEKYPGRPVILLGKFKMIHDKHITFTTIRPYIKGTHTITLCDHVNLFRPDVEPVIDIASLERNRKYYIIAYCTPYSKSDRMGIKLATDVGFPPIIRAEGAHVIPKEAFEICQRFSSEDYVRKNQRHQII